MREKVPDFTFLEETNRLLRSGGLLLASAGEDRKPNAMTIGWGLVGTLWRQPFFIIAVRLSRYTHKLIENSKRFTVCLPGKNMEQALDVCGSESGREVDKLKKLGLTAKKGFGVEAPFIEECPVHYECNVAYQVELKPGQLESELEKEVYPKGNYHVLYFGLIKGVYAEEDASEKLRV